MASGLAPGHEVATQDLMLAMVDCDLQMQT